MWKLCMVETTIVLVEFVAYYSTGHVGMQVENDWDEIQWYVDYYNQLQIH